MRSKALALKALSYDEEHSCEISFAPCLPGPERLVALGFRYWILGRDTGEIGCWERAFNLYQGHFGVAGARVALTQLSLWVAAVDNAARRDIEVFPASCRSFCRDECLAVSMIAACQHQTCRQCAPAPLHSPKALVSKRLSRRLRALPTRCSASTRSCRPVRSCRRSHRSRQPARLYNSLNKELLTRNVTVARLVLVPQPRALKGSVEV